MKRLTYYYMKGSENDGWYLKPGVSREKANARLAYYEDREEQDCGWCYHFERDRQYLIGKGNGMYEELIFQFCPMCGRKLPEV